MTPSQTQQQPGSQLCQERIEINPTLLAFLKDKEQERDALIMRLRSIDALLIEHGRLRHETLPRRVR